MRLDRWLWFTRFYKTRGLAAAAVSAGHVRVDGQRTKAGKAIQCGDVLTITKGVETWQLTVRALPERRGPASEAHGCYEEDPASEAARAQRRAQRRASRLDPPTSGRPDKRTRRLIRARQRND